MKGVGYFFQPADWQCAGEDRVPSMFPVAWQNSGVSLEKLLTIEMSEKDFFEALKVKLS